MRIDRTLLVLFALTAPAVAQEQNTVFKQRVAEYAGLPSTIPQEVADAIKGATNIKTVIPITGAEKFSEQVIKADEIVFDTKSHLIVSNLQAPWIAIVAKKVRFRDPLSYSFIERDLSVRSADPGSEGQTGAKGKDDYGETNRRGNDGHPGAPGAPGGTGGTLQLPSTSWRDN
ncbi:hypothetical protein [Rhizobium leguminosarum]|uniref:hypothetical protein n=1 Tax=Rhizobium leguminosarum TaxID=384 RepID=UPI003F9C5130